MRLTSALLLAPLTALLLGAASVIYLPFDQGDVLLWVGLLLPLLWSLFVFYSYWPEAPARPLKVLAGTSAVSALLIWLAW